MTLAELYAERAHLRARRKHLSAELEKLVEPEGVNARAINALLKKMPPPSIDPAREAPLVTTRDDLPEYFYERAAE